MKKLFLFWMIAASWGAMFAQDSDKPLAYWPLDKGPDRTVEEVMSGHWVPVFSNFDTPEFVDGIQGSALRFDGYSTRIEGMLPAEINGSLLAEGWFALESFPTDTAGFISLKSKDEEEWIMAGVDRFGSPVITIGQEGRPEYYVGEKTIDRFKWHKFSLKAEGEKTVLMIDGDVVVKTDEGIDLEKLDSYVLGQGPSPKYLVDRFVVNRINGILDEVKLWSPVSDPQKSLIRKSDEPDLAIPESRFEYDFSRPAYHLLPAANWTNETHGLIEHNGKFHIFNQKNGTNLFLGQINWGHFSSDDLVSWTEHKPAITPGPDYDRNGIWSGHAITSFEGEPLVMYTGSDGETFGMCLAEPKDDDLIEWDKYDGNPVVNGVPEGFTRGDFRDPFIWKQDSLYYMMVGFGIVEKGVEKGALLLYRSADMKDWDYRGLLFKGNPELDNSGVFWEMPVFWKFDDQYVLLVNKVPHEGAPARAMYWNGKFEEERFVPHDSVPKNLEVVNRFLSPSLMRMKSGKSVAIGIIPDEIHYKAQLENGWTHLYSIPREWTYREGKIRQRPYEGIRQLRADSAIITSFGLNNDKRFLTSGHQKEIVMELTPGECKRFGFIAAEHPSGMEKTKIIFDMEDQKVRVDRRSSSKRPFIPLDTREGDFEMKPGKLLKINAFFDGSVIEVFINDEDAFTTRIFPQSRYSNNLSVFSEDGDVRIDEIKVYDLSSSENITDW